MDKETQDFLPLHKALMNLGGPSTIDLLMEMRFGKKDEEDTAKLLYDKRVDCSYYMIQMKELFTEMDVFTKTNKKVHKRIKD